MWIYTNVTLPGWFGQFKRQSGRQLVCLDGTRLFIHHDGARSTLVAQYPNGKRLGLHTGTRATAAQAFSFVRRALEEGYNYLDLVCVEQSLGPVRHPIRLGVRAPFTPWQPSPEPEPVDASEIDFPLPKRSGVAPWILPLDRETDDSGEKE